MPGCPNCGRQTMRTEDWVCQWCGYPLLGRGYKKIDKTFKQLQEERRLGAGESETERDIEPELEAEEAPEPEARPVPKPSPRPEPRPEPRAVSKPAPRPAPPPEPEPEDEDEIEPELEAEAEPEPEPEAPVSRPKPPPRPELKFDPEPELVPALDPGPVLARLGAPSGALQVSVDELNAVYQADKLAAHTRLTNKVLTITGLVEKMFVKEHLDIRYIVLTGSRGTVWKVRCTFDKENAEPLHHLAEGGAAAVRGKYDGYGNNIIMKGCALVS